ncbi:MAG: EAL domain-containing protein [Phycisphaerales bacterium]
MTIDVERLRAQLDATVLSGAVRTVFQPIVDLKCGEIAGFETLTRLSDASEFRSPSELFDAAERTGQLWAVEEVTRRSSLDSAVRWPAGAKLFLNTTPQVFADPRFCSELLRAVRATPGLTPTRIVLEITERTAQQHDQSLDEQVRLVKAAGFEVAIDDVGAGTSGLNRIMALRPHWLKLDRELIEQISRDRVRQNLIRFFLRFATLSGVKLIAEGIEREDELATLMDLGVVFGQGYFLGRPGSREQKLSPEVRDFIRARHVRGNRGQSQDPRSNDIRRYVRPVMQVDSHSKTIDVASEVMRRSNVSGVVVTEAGQPVAWCERDALLRHAADDMHAQQIGYVVRPGVVCASPDTTIPDALELASGREERVVGSPLIVADDTGVLGLLSIGDLLHAAADLAKETQLRIAPLTGLPGRVLADEHLTRLLSPGDPTIAGKINSTTHDVALLNIRGFSRYNETMGFELGDELLRRVAELFRTRVRADHPEVFFAHVGNDRFLATAPTGVLQPALELFLKEFDARESLLAAGKAGATIPRLRVVLALEVNKWIAGVQMFYRLGDQWHREPGPISAQSEFSIVSAQSDVLRHRASA